MGMKELHLNKDITIKIPADYELKYAHISLSKQSGWAEGSSETVTEVHYRISEV